MGPSPNHSRSLAVFTFIKTQSLKLSLVTLTPYDLGNEISAETPEDMMKVQGAQKKQIAPEVTWSPEIAAEGKLPEVQDESPGQRCTQEIITFSWPGTSEVYHHSLSSVQGQTNRLQTAGTAEETSVAAFPPAVKVPEPYQSVWSQKATGKGLLSLSQGAADSLDLTGGLEGSRN